MTKVIVSAIWVYKSNHVQIYTNTVIHSQLFGPHYFPSLLR